MNQPNTKWVHPFVTSVASASGSALAVALSVVAGCLLVSLGAQLRIPVPGSDVPMTFQLLAVLLTGYALSPARAAAAMVLYVICGAAGLPVFAGSGGLAGATGGYILAFVVAAWLVSFLKGGNEAGILRLFTAGVAGTFAVFALGIAWRILGVLLVGGGANQVWLAVTTGLTPFAAKTVVELLLAVTCVHSVRSLRTGRGPGGAAVA